MKKTVLRTSLITVASILINLLGKTITVRWNLPLWFDSLGTLIAAFCLGPVSGAITGAASNLILGFSDPKTYIFICIGVCIGASAGYCARKGKFDTFFTSMTYASVLAVVTTVLSAVLDLSLLSGETGNIWGNAVIRFFTKAGLNPITACFIGQFYLEFIDKIVTVSVFYLLLKAYRRLRGSRRKHSASEEENSKHSALKHSESRTGISKSSQLNVSKSKGAGAFLLMLCCLLSAFSLGLAGTQELSFVKAAEKTAADTADTTDTTTSDDSSIQRIYNESNGLTPGHATSLATTFDGMLWVGTYAGLYRFDGQVFTHFKSSEIKNVNCLYTDTEGRLWVGTNDNGLAIIIRNELVNVVNSANGLCSDSVRSIVQASDGTVYVGTSDYMQTVSVSNGISVTGSLETLNYVRSASAGPDGLVAAVTEDNRLYLLNRGKILDSVGPDDLEVTSVAFRQGEIYTGTADGDLETFSIQDQKLVPEGHMDANIGSLVNQVIPESSGACLVVCDNGLYRIQPDGSRQKISSDDFSFSLQSAVYDYQKNLWVASSRQGLLEISPSAYTDLFTRYNVSGRIVNAVLRDGSLLYAGCDDGLQIIDTGSGQTITNPLTEALQGTRVRALAMDSSGTIYAASYSRGLVSMDRRGIVNSYAGSDSQGNKARSVIVTTDNTVVASGDNGVSFLRDGKIQSLIPYGNSLGKITVLSLCELQDGSIAAVTDGNGVYLLRNGAIAEHYTKQNGLGSNVVLKAVPARKGDAVFFVTSNGITALEDGKLRQLSDFPYSNNYDIIPDDQGNLYITGSAGIYLTTEKDLLSKDGRDATLSGPGDGLPYNLTANSQNLCDGSFLYLCGNGGIIRVDRAKLSDRSSSIRFYVKKVTAGDQEYQVSDDYRVTIPGDSGRIVITPEIINYIQPYPIVYYRLKGYDGKWHAMGEEDMSGINYSGLKAGNYTFVMDIRDRNGKTLEENSFSFYISEELYERVYFRVYLVAVLLLLIGWISWFFTHLILTNREKRTRAALELARKQVEMGNESVLAMAKALFSKDRRTGEHCHRVAYYAERLGRAYGFSEKETRNLKKAALLHDIGKIAIPDAILNKPAKLTDEEYAIMKTHTTAGAEILKGFTIVDHVSEGARYHHERYDGKGYPEGISGDSIPLYGRIIAVCDTFDAMTANRVYRGALDMEHVMGELQRGRGTQFDPHLDDLFMELVESGEIDPKKTFEMFQNRDLTEDIE